MVCPVRDHCKFIGTAVAISLIVLSGLFMWSPIIRNVDIHTEHSFHGCMSSSSRYLTYQWPGFDYTGVRCNHSVSWPEQLVATTRKRSTTMCTVLTDPYPVIMVAIDAIGSTVAIREERLDIMRTKTPSCTWSALKNCSLKGKCRCRFPMWNDTGLSSAMNTWPPILYAGAVSGGVWKHLKLVDTSEPNTTKTCSICLKGEMKPCMWKPYSNPKKMKEHPDKRPEMRGLRCFNNVECGVFVNRDQNAGEYWMEPSLPHLSWTLGSIVLPRWQLQRLLQQTYGGTGLMLFILKGACLSSEEGKSIAIDKKKFVQGIFDKDHLYITKIKIMGGDRVFWKQKRKSRKSFCMDLRIIRAQKWALWNKEWCRSHRLL